MDRLHKKTYFFLALILFYLLIFFAPNKPIYFAAYFVACFLFYLATKNLRLSFILTLILSLFSDIGMGASLFLLNPEILNLGSGYWISPQTLMIFFLLILSIRFRFKKLYITDIALLFFFSWIIIFFIFFPLGNIFYGVLFLGELLIIYYLLRLHLTKEYIYPIWWILLSMLLFQSIIGFIQLFQGSIGIMAETSLRNYPFGLTVVEEENLFRITGTYGHANFLASFIVTIFPFLLLYNFSLPVFNIFKVVPIIALFFTYSRSAWFVFLVVTFIYFITAKKDIFFYFKSLSLSLKFISLLLIFILVFPLFPFFLARLETLPQAFIERGSMDVRIKLIKEGFNLVANYPLTGVGLNYANLAYAYTPETDILSFALPTKFYSIHNTFLEIAAEAGLVGFFSFSLFVFFIIKSYFIGKKNFSYNREAKFRTAAFLSLTSLILMSSFHPFFHSTQFRLFFLLGALILV